MSDKIKFRLVLLVLLLITVGLCLCLGPISINSIIRPYDTARLAMFALRIDGADRVVATRPGSSVSLTLTGEDAKKITRAVSSAVLDAVASAGNPNPKFEGTLKFSDKATFYKVRMFWGILVWPFHVFLLAMRFTIALVSDYWKLWFPLHSKKQCEK